MKYKVILLLQAILMCMNSLAAESNEAEIPKVWYFTNFYGHYVDQDISACIEAARTEGIALVNDQRRLYKYLPQFRPDYGNAARLSDDQYRGAILIIPEQEFEKELSLLRDFVEDGGRVVVLFNAVSANYASHVNVFKDAFDVEFTCKEIAVTPDILHQGCFTGGYLCPLWRDLIIGSKSWKKAGIDAYVKLEGEGWSDQVYIRDAAGEEYCISAKRRLGKGHIIFQVAPNNCRGEENSSGRLHESEEFFFPGIVSELDNLEAFLSLVRWAAQGTIAPTFPEPLPSHETGMLDRLTLHEGEEITGKIMRQDETEIWIDVAGTPKSLPKENVLTFEINRECWPCFVQGIVLLKDMGPAAGCKVDIQWRESMDRHVVITDGNGAFSCALDIPGSYEYTVSAEDPYVSSNDRFKADHGQRVDLEITLYKHREARVRWCYSPGSSGDFTGRKIGSVEATLSTKGLDRVKFTGRGMKDVCGESDFLVLQKNGQLYIRNFDVCGSGHGIVDLGIIDFQSVHEVPPNTVFTTEPEPTLEPGKVLLIKTYDGKGYVKMLVEEVMDERISPMPQQE